MLNCCYHGTNHNLMQTWILESLHPPVVTILNPSSQGRLQCKMHPRCQPPLPPSR